MSAGKKGRRKRSTDELHCSPSGHHPRFLRKCRQSVVRHESGRYLIREPAADAGVGAVAEVDVQL